MEFKLDINQDVISQIPEDGMGFHEVAIYLKDESFSYFAILLNQELIKIDFPTFPVDEIVSIKCNNIEILQKYFTTVTLVTGCPEDIYPNFGYVSHNWKEAEKELKGILASYSKEEYHIVSTPVDTKEELIDKLHSELKDRGYVYESN
jgi:hypothetical protein